MKREDIMSEPLSILLIAKNQNRIDDIRKEIQLANGFSLDMKQVATIKEIIGALTKSHWDIILCNHCPDMELAGSCKADCLIMDMLSEMNLDIPVIMITDSLDPNTAHTLLEKGILQYVDFQNIRQLAPMIKREKSLQTAHDEILKGWTAALHYRDHETEEHSMRVVELTVQLARLMHIPEPQIRHIERGALLHDVGKLGIPDSILKKKDKLTNTETEQMKEHAEIGYLLLKTISFLRQAVDIPHYHHERWNGSGYPYGLEGESIPLSARIFAVVDVFDAMVSNRPYRPALSQNFVLKYIISQSGVLFDPAVVEAFIALFPTFDGGS